MYLIGMEETSGRKATAVGKPAPGGFLASAARLGVDPEEMYMVGDDLNNDVLAAQVVGMTGVLVRTGQVPPGHVGSLGRRRIRDAAQPRHRLGRRPAGAVGALAVSLADCTLVRVVSRCDVSKTTVRSAKEI